VKDEPELDRRNAMVERMDRAGAGSLIVQRFGGVEALGAPYPRISMASMVRKRAGWLAALFLGEMLTATAIGYFQVEISKAVMLARFIPLIISSGGNSGSQATSLIIRALAPPELKLRDWWRVGIRELPTGLVRGSVLGVIGIFRILTWQRLGAFRGHSCGRHWTDHLLLGRLRDPARDVIVRA
jgi:magnesium transporter